MVTRYSLHGHKAFINMTTDENVTDSLWEYFFSGLVNVLDVCKHHSSNANLDVPSTAIGHLRVPLYLRFKASLSAKPFL